MVSVLQFSTDLVEAISPRAFGFLPFIILFKNNNRIRLSLSDVAEYLDCSRSTAKSVLLELVAQGILEQESKSGNVGSLYLVNLGENGTLRSTKKPGNSTTKIQQTNSENTAEIQLENTDKTPTFEGILYIPNSKELDINTSNAHTKNNYQNTPEEQPTKSKNSEAKKTKSTSKTSSTKTPPIDYIGTEPSSPKDLIPQALQNLFSEQGKIQAFEKYPNIWISEAEYETELKENYSDANQGWLANVLQERSTSLHEYKGVPEWKHFRRSRCHVTDMRRLHKGMIRNGYRWDEGSKGYVK